MDVRTQEHENTFIIRDCALSQQICTVHSFSQSHSCKLCRGALSVHGWSKLHMYGRGFPFILLFYTRWNQKPFIWSTCFLLLIVLSHSLFTTALLSSTTIFILWVTTLLHASPTQDILLSLIIILFISLIQESSSIVYQCKLTLPACFCIASFLIELKRKVSRQWSCNTQWSFLTSL